MTIKAVGQRDMSVQEVMHQLLLLKFFSSSFQVIVTSLGGSRKVEFSSHEVIIEPPALDNYAMRETFRDNHPEMMQCIFIQFVSNYYVN